jgi:tetratricopeptide (TPR) repeat protein
MIRALTLSVSLLLTTLGGAWAQSAERLDQLFTALAGAGEDEWEAIETDIWVEWSHSGSAAMDLLLERGRQAMAAGDSEAAIAHLSALIDHAPDFPEGWNARATAYFQAGLYGPSLADIRQVLALEPRHFGALAGLGLILEEIGEEAGALEAYRLGAEVHPRRTSFVEGIARLERKVLGKGI